MAGEAFIVLGLIFFVGLATDLLGRKTRLPRVSLLLLFGFLLGPSGFELLSAAHETWMELASQLALVMVGFLVGGHLSREALKAHGRLVLNLSLAVTVLTMLVVGLGLLLLGMPVPMALLLAAMATATAPAATLDVVNESGAQGPFSDTLLGVVAIDDVWGLLLFSVVLTVLDVLSGHAGSEALQHGAIELFGSLALGLALGLPMALLTGRIQDGEPTQAEALGFVFLCTGLALWLGLSYLLAAIVMGMTVANVAQHHKYPFHAIEGIEWPFLIVFFLCAGASIDLSSLHAGGWALMAYVALRVLGRLIGGYLGARLGQAPPRAAAWYGPALLPQAGVAIGMALLGAQRFPQYADALLSIAIGATVIFELIGPIATRRALNAQSEIVGSATS